MQQQSLILLALLVWAAALTVGAAPEPTVPVKARLERAGKEPPAAALAPLHEARAPAESGKDHVALFAVAATAHRPGASRQEAADHAAAEQLYRLTLSVREQQVPGTAEWFPSRWPRCRLSPARFAAAPRPPAPSP